MTIEDVCSVWGDDSATLRRGRNRFGEKKPKLWVKINQRPVSNLGTWLWGWRALEELRGRGGLGDAGQINSQGGNREEPAAHQHSQLSELQSLGACGALSA